MNYSNQIKSSFVTLWNASQSIDLHPWQWVSPTQIGGPALPYATIRVIPLDKEYFSILMCRQEYLVEIKIYAGPDSGDLLSLANIVCSIFDRATLNIPVIAIRPEPEDNQIEEETIGGQICQTQTLRWSVQLQQGL